MQPLARPGIVACLFRTSSDKEHCTTGSDAWAMLRRSPQFPFASQCQNWADELGSISLTPE